MKPLIEDLITFIEWIGEIALDTASIEVKWFFEDLEDIGKKLAEYYLIRCTLLSMLNCKPYE